MSVYGKIHTARFGKQEEEITPLEFVRPLEECARARGSLRESWADRVQGSHCRRPNGSAVFQRKLLRTWGVEKNKL